MIVVTGATGQLGRAIIDGLLARVPADEVVASVREPAEASSLVTAGVRVRAGEFNEPHGLDAAFAGAMQVLIVSADKLSEEALRLHRNAIGAAVEGGARRILYTSHMGARAGSPFSRRRTSTLVRRQTWKASGAAFTALRQASTPRAACT